jgi:uncharacterized Zn-finger protein
VQYCKLSQHFSSTGSETVCFTFQSLKLDSTDNESTYLVTNIRAKEQLGEERETMSRYQTCSTSFTHQRTVVKEMRGYERHFSCDVCKISFTSRYNLDRHTRVHTGERQFSCEVCNKRFSLRSNLIMHLRVHTGERGFSWEVCKEHFALRSVLKKHLRLHTRKRPFSCKICKKTFNSKLHLKHAYQIAHWRTTLSLQNM